MATVGDNPLGHLFQARYDACEGAPLAAIDIPHVQAEALCAISKVADAAIWQPGAKEGSRVLVMGVICAPPRRGLHVEIYMHRGHKVLRRTFDFGLWDNSSGVMERVYQLTVADSFSPTHTEKGVVWFGSHEHMGDTPTQLIHLDSVDFKTALQLFMSKVSLTIKGGDIDDPMEFKLK